MSTTPATEGPAMSPTPEAQLYVSLRQRLLVVTGVVAVLALAIAWLARGLPGLWGALIAAGTGIVFMLTTVVITGWAAKRAPQLLTAAMLGSWLGKMIVAFVIVLAIRSLTFYDKASFLLALAAVVLAGLAVEAATVLRAREAYSLQPPSNS